MTRSLPIAMVVLAAAITACDDRPLDGPPQLRLGRDECAECGMSILDDRSAAASIVVKDGQREYFLVDDVGCMLDWEREHADVEVAARFVRDYDSRSWIAADVAAFVIADGIQTPMASGIAAFSTRPSADAARERHGGAVFSWGELAAARVRWLQDNGRLVRP